MPDSSSYDKTKPCPYCGEMILGTAVFCKHCRMALDSGVNASLANEELNADEPAAPQDERDTEPVFPNEESRFFDPVRSNSIQAISATASLSEIVSSLHSRIILGVSNNIASTLLWFALANIAVLLTLMLISGGAFSALWPYVLALGCITPFVILAISKWLAHAAHNMHRVAPGLFRSSEEEKLYQLVEVLARRANLPRTPEVWLYRSDDMNAFATGPSRTNAMIAFSDGLLMRMDARAIAAVAAHEISHIANGDMLTMTVIQSVVNMVSLMITIPLWLTQFMASFLSGVLGSLCRWIIYVLTWIITSIVFILGLLLVMYFSRKREFSADALASQLVDADSMIHALETLATETPIVPIEQRAFSTFKINNRAGWTNVFSTHPSIDNRIRKLQESLIEPETYF